MARIKTAVGKGIAKVSWVGLVLSGFTLLKKGNWVGGIFLIVVGFLVAIAESFFSPKKGITDD